MGKPAEIEPRWLVSLMCVWATSERARDNGHSGYPNHVAWLTVRGGGPSIPDPTSFCAQDFTELNEALEELRESHLGQLMAMVMYYKPWGVEACRAEGWPFGDSTYYARLHAGHAKVAATIERLRGMKEQRVTYISLDDTAELEYKP
jgi:hypothetical protein